MLTRPDDLSSSSGEGRRTAVTHGICRPDQTRTFVIPSIIAATAVILTGCGVARYQMPAGGLVVSQPGRCRSVPIPDRADAALRCVEHFADGAIAIGWVLLRRDIIRKTDLESFDRLAGAEADLALAQKKVSQHLWREAARHAMNGIDAATETDTEDDLSELPDQGGGAAQAEP